MMVTRTTTRIVNEILCLVNRVNDSDLLCLYITNILIDNKKYMNKSWNKTIDTLVLKLENPDKIQELLSMKK